LQCRLAGDAIVEGLVIGSRLFVCWKALSKTGGNGDFREPSQMTLLSSGGHELEIIRICDGVPACLEAARDELRQDVDFCGESEHVTTHTYANEAIWQAVDNGVMGIENSNFVDEATAMMYTDKGFFSTDL
jgi:hypothetical protein